MPPTATTPKVQVGTSVTPEMRVAIEDYALAHGVKAPTNADGTPKLDKNGNPQGPEIASIIFDAICAHIGYTPPVEEKRASQLTDDERKARQRARDEANRAAASAKLAELRARNRESETAALAEGAAAENGAAETPANP